MSYEKTGKAVALDFDDSITNLDGRAKKARVKMTLIGLLLILMIQGLVVLIFTQYQDSDKRLFAAEFERNARSAGLESALERRGMKIVESLNSHQLNQTQRETAEIELQETVKLLNSIQKSSGSNTGEMTSFGANWATIAFSVGAVGFVVLLIQIAVQFMRYYASLAELYAAQANALRASNGDPEVAFILIQHFSPISMEIGKGPSTIYEKSLETIKAVAEKKQ